MSKRTPGLPQRPNGFWPTPKSAVAPLVPYLPLAARYGEPCAGDGAIIKALDDLWPGGRCVWASDINPKDPDIEEIAVSEIRPHMAEHVGIWLTNPPWPKIGKKGDPAVGIIAHLMTMAQVWALLPWDFAANDYFRALWPQCSDALPIGRVSWMGNGTPGKDNAGWFRFDQAHRRGPMICPRPEKLPAGLRGAA